MNVLFLDQFSQLGGAQSCFLDAVPAFCRRGWQVKAILPGEGPFPEKLRALGVGVESIPACALSSIRKPMSEALRYVCWCPDVARRIARAAASFSADLLYVNGPRLLPPAAWIARQTGIPLLFHAHNRLLQRSALVLTGRALRFARARVVACCDYVADCWRPYLPLSRLDVVYNGVRDLYEGTRPGLQQRKTVGVIGRIEPEKGQLDFVRAARLIDKILPHVRFVVVGAPLLSGDESYYHQTVAESRELPVEFTGWQHSISSVLSGLDLLVVPSLSFDATPRVVIEAFSARVPVLAYASGGLPEIIQDSETGFLVPTPSPEALAGRILDVLEARSEFVAQIVANARRAWDEKFGIDLFQQQVCNKIIQCVEAA